MDAQGAKFLVLHLSDELGEDPIDMYELDGCVKVMRMASQGYALR